jgi:hypothetical protein
MRITRVSPARRRRPLRVVSSTDPRIVEAFADLKAAHAAHAAELIGHHERERLRGRALDRLKAAGFEFPPPKPRPARRLPTLRIDLPNAELATSPYAARLKERAKDRDLGQWRDGLFLHIEEVLELAQDLRSIAACCTRTYLEVRR